MEAINPRENSIDVLCSHCGKTFSEFLHQMADQNAKVVCPTCRDEESKDRKRAEPESERVRRKLREAL